VVENVENLGAKLHVFGFAKNNLFVNREVPVVEARATANGTLRAIV